MRLNLFWKGVAITILIFFITTGFIIVNSNNLKISNSFDTAGYNGIFKRENKKLFNWFLLCYKI